MRRLLPIALVLGMPALLAACASSARHAEYEVVSGRIDAVAAVVKPEWEALSQARLKGESLDGAYVFDVCAVYFEVLTAGVQMVDAAANNRGAPTEAQATIASAEKHLRLLMGRSRAGAPQAASVRSEPVLDQTRWTPPN